MHALLYMTLQLLPSRGGIHSPPFGDGLASDLICHWDIIGSAQCTEFIWLSPSSVLTENKGDLIKRELCIIWRGGW